MPEVETAQQTTIAATMSGESQAAPDRTGFENEYPFASHFLDLDGSRMHYVDEGSGSPLLMVHGNPTWSFAWRNLVQAFSPRYRTLAVDHIGCGFSDKPQAYSYTLQSHIENLCRFVESHDLHEITLVAHDWGGAIGMGAAGRMPERFSRFVLMNTAAFRSQRIPWRIAVCRIPWLGAIALRGLNLFSRAALWMAVEKRQNLSPAIKRGYLAPYDSWAHRIAVQSFVHDIPLKPSHESYETLVAVENGLAQFVEHPMLLAWGERDWCFTPAFLEEFEQRFPRAQTHRIADAGHYVFEDAREELVDTIARFLEETSADDSK